MRSIAWVNFVLGIWLFVSPFALHFSESKAAATNQHTTLDYLILFPTNLGFHEDKAAINLNSILGFLIAALALWRAVGMSEKLALAGFSWIVAFFGLMIMIASFVLMYSSIRVAMWNDVIVGAAITTLTIFNAVKQLHASTMRHDTS